MGFRQGVCVCVCVGGAGGGGGAGGVRDNSKPKVASSLLFSRYITLI